jgi:hypothetical protein
VLRRVAEPAIAVQIETKKIHHLCVSHQQFTEAKRQNVGTLLTVSHVEIVGGLIASFEEVQ